MSTKVGEESSESAAVSLTDPLSCFEVIGRVLGGNAPEPWTEIAVDFTIIAVDDVCEYAISYKPRHYRRGRPKQFFVDDSILAESFYALAKLTSDAEKGYFQTCRFVMKADGKYSADFKYADMTPNTSLERTRGR